MKKPVIATLAAFLAAVAAIAIWVARDPHDPEQSYSGSTMGTRYTVRITRCDLHDCDAVADALAQRLSRLVMLFSHYEPESELSRFNRVSNRDWIPVSPELVTVVRYALDVAEVSGGAFDITVAPAVDAWGFGAQDTLGEPTQAAIAAATKSIGYEQVALRLRPPALRKLNPDIRLDLSAVAKGYAVDDLSLVLEDRGIFDYLIEIGGEIRTSGSKSLGRPWRIGIESPEGDPTDQVIITPGAAAVATSGDYRNFFIQDGQRRQHTIDPRTASPVLHNLAAVTVIMPSAMQADALATLLMVLGPEEGFRYAVEREIPALFRTREDIGLATLSTPEFRRYLTGSMTD